MNPQNCIIRKGDILYVICESFEVVREIFLIDRKDAPEYIKYATNMIAMQKNLSSKYFINLRIVEKILEKLLNICIQIAKKSTGHFRQKIGQNKHRKIPSINLSFMIPTTWNMKCQIFYSKTIF